MNYEKAYKEALEVMEQWIAPCHTKEQLNTMKKAVFPELAESEDERVRKQILEYFSQFENEELRGVNIHSWIAWLEKQKESNPDKFIEEYWRGYNSGLIKGKQIAEDEYNTEKPVEWSEEDERLLNIIIDILDREEHNGHLTRGDLKACVKLLKSLHPSWKPSEQEKSALRTAIFILTEERNFPKAAAQLQNILDAFEGKESRKDWKPSKEQLSGIECVIKTMQHQLNVGDKRLNSLFEDLKKL